ncbi:MAG: hypothetical protein COA79_12410 [Planctomycetota bacterium]|nr:MAG: hypothetical protein COA79_12410 [Planctomycetota bacterium]
MKRRMVVQEYDKSWPINFEIAKKEITTIFGDTVLSIYHIGSTSIPGMTAKPTIDMLCVVSKGTMIPEYYDQMLHAGFECRGECLDAIIPGTAGRFYFPRIIETKHVTHVNVCHDGHPDNDAYLIFRDYLRKHPNDVKEYGDHKIKIAAENEYDNIGYMRGKDALIKDLIQRALQWKNTRKT